MRLPWNNIFSFSIIGFLLFFNAAFADDPGITKARLIQETDTTYTFETDIAQALLWAIKAPVFPDRFKIDDLNIENQSGWITLKAHITTSQEPLSQKDEIILPWVRNGVDITVQWKDGKTFKGLYRRTLNGIHIPLKELMPVQKTTQEVLWENFLMGMKHLPFKLVHIFLIMALVWAIPSIKVIRYVFVITLGQWVSMILIGLGIPGIDLLFSEILLLITILLISYSVIYNIKFKYLAFLLFLSGVIHGMSFVHEISVINLPKTQQIQALFAFAFAIDLGHYLLVLILLPLIPLLQRTATIQRWIPLLTGSMAVFLFLLIARENVLTNHIQILDLQRTQVSATYKASAKAPDMSGRQALQGKGLMTTPVMVYLSVEPYEVRQEILVTAEAAIRFLGYDLHGETRIPPKLQAKIKKDLQDVVSSLDSTIIDNRLVFPVEQITNFVTLGRGGVATRENPVEENLKDAILGITLIYETESFPDSILSKWKVFPDSVQVIEASAVDPHGSFTAMLSPQKNTLRWKSRLKGYEVPAIEPIEVEKQARSLVSILLWLGVLVILSYQFFKWRTLDFKPWLIVLLVLGFVSYPFVRFQLDIPFAPQGKPSAEKAGVIVNDLLTNVYRAFDRREEEDVYDRLALSVSKEQLTEIYLQNRQSMAMENRGGARANVDEVNIQELFDVERDKNGGYIADAKWTVRGSVNHFGHTHYRQNQYRANVYFVIDNNNWKINDIEILDTRRLY